MMKFFSKKKGPVLSSSKGFTLIELLVVIAIIGLLSSIVLVSMGPARKKARDARRVSDIRQINLAMEMCYDDSGCGGGTEKYPLTTAAANALASIGSYLNPVPKDPTDVSPYRYNWTANSAAPAQKYYCVYDLLEAPSAATYVCSSNKGVITVATTTVPTNANCCGANVIP